MKKKILLMINYLKLIKFKTMLINKRKNLNIYLEKDKI